MLKAEYLLAFCLVAKHKSISKTAQVLGLSQPAVSTQLANLQKQTGQTLYTRKSHGIALTPAGKDFLPYACAVAKTVQQAERYLRDESGGRIQLNIGLSHHLVPLITGPLLKTSRALQRSHEEVDVHLREAYSQRLIELVKHRELDAAFIVADEDMNTEPLWLESLKTEAIVLLVKLDDPLAKESTVNIGSLNNETLILSSSQSQVYRKVKRYLAQSQVQAGRLLEVSGPSAVKNAVLDGLGIGFTLASYAKREVEANWLKTVYLDKQDFSVTLALIMHDPATLEPQRSGVLGKILALPLSEHSQAQ